LSCPHCDWKDVATRIQKTNTGKINGHLGKCPNYSRKSTRLDGDGVSAHNEGDSGFDSGFDFGEQVEIEDEEIAEVESYVEVPQISLETVEEVLRNAIGRVNKLAEQEVAPPLPPSKLTATEVVSGSNKDLFDHQTVIMELLANPTRRMMKDKDLSLVLEVYRLGLELSLSDAEGDKLLASYCTVYERTLKVSGFISIAEKDKVNPEHFKDKVDPQIAKKGKFFCPTLGLHTNWKSLRKAVEQNLLTTCKLIHTKIPLPVELFPTTDLKGKPITDLITSHYGILQRIAEEFLSINPKEIFIKPCPAWAEKIQVADGEDSSRLYGNYASAKLYARSHEYVTNQFGSSAVSVNVALFFDEALAGKSATACPVSAFIMNAFGDSYRPVFLGMCPVSLHYTDQYLSRLLEKGRSKRPTKLGKKFAIRFAKRQALLKYLKTVLSPLQENEKVGFKLQVGQGSGAFLITAYFQFSHFMGDSAALNDIASVKLYSNGARCRVCNEMNCNNVDPSSLPCQPRNSKTMAALCQQLGAYEIEKFVEGCKSHGKRKTLTKSYREVRSKVINLGKEMGVIPGFNPLIGLFDTPSVAGVNNFYLALRIDYLHTLWKGMLENAVTYMLQTVLCVSNSPHIFGDKYSGVFAELDDRISQFPTKQTLEPVRLFHLNSVSDLMKCEAVKGQRQGRGTGLLAGHFPGFQMANLVLQLLFAIGLQGNIIPNEDIKYSNQRSYNPTQVAITTMAACLEVEYFSHAKVISGASLQLMSKAILDAKWKLIEFYDMKQNLLRHASILKPLALKSSSSSSSSSKHTAVWELPKVLKPHYMQHIPAQIEDLGAEEQIFCTQLGERSHHPMVTVAYSRSSKVRDSVSAEMCIFNLKADFLRRLVPIHDIQTRQKEKKKNPQGESLKFVDCPTFGKVELIFTENSSFVGVCNGDSLSNGSIPFLHPLLKPEEIYSLVTYMRDSDREDKSNFAKKWYVAYTKGRTSRVATLHLRGGISCLGHVDSGCKPFHIRANPQYKGNSRVKGRTEFVFSSVEIDYEQSSYKSGAEQTTFAKVLAIFDFTLTSSSGSRNEIWLGVVRYEKLQEASKFVFPYHSYKIESLNRRRGLGLDILPLSSVRRPAFMVPSSDGALEETPSNFGAMVYHCIPFDRCVKTDNSRSTETKVQPQFATSSELSQANVTMGTFSKDCDTDGLGLRRCKSAGDVSDFEESDSDRESDMEEYKWG